MSECFARKIGLLCAWSLCLLLCACMATPVPMPTLAYGASDGQRNPNLLVLLRGLGGEYTDFEAYGIIDEIHKRGLPFDVIVPDAHFGYYRNRTIDVRLKQDIIEPARRQGYRQVWLAGFSMGGLGSLLYLRSNPHDVDGIMLISPFLGWGSIIKEIRAAGGVAQWQPGPYDDDDWERLLWDWIRTYSQTAGDYPPIYLGFGNNDILSADGPGLLATVLAKERAFSVPGGHDITTMRTIFRGHLDRLSGTLARLPQPPR